MKTFKRDKGFTLIELMVVVLIIGILVAIAIPVFNGAKANAQKRACFANERTVDGAARAYEASQGTLPDSVADLVAGNYIKPPGPTCKSDGVYSFDNVTGELSCSIHGRY